MDLSIVIPCYNEVDNVDKIEAELFPVLAQMARTRSIEVVFVDDGSKDGTYDAFSKAFGAQRDGVTIRFERHQVNRGLGAAIRTGLNAARGDIIVTADSDGTYKFDTIPALLARLTDGVDIVTASPYHPDGEVVGVPAYRLVLSQGSSFIYRILLDWRIHCYTALFRAYRRQVVEQVTFESNGFLGGTELLIKAIIQGFKVAEYPTKLHSRVFGASKAKIARTIAAHLKFQGWVLAHRLNIRKIESIGNPAGGQRWA
ncbi:MAG: glycosyltransferase family 2 protein [Caldilineaceae bacterium]